MICADCYKAGGGCCRCEIFLTLSDAKRISEKTGKKVKEFVAFRKAPKYYSELNKDDPEFNFLFRESKLLFMKTDKKRNCVFLGSKGCSIFDVRPRICRLMPFWYERDGKGKVSVFLCKEDNIDDENCSVSEKFFNEEKVEKSLAGINETRKSMTETAKLAVKEYAKYNEYADEIVKGIPYEEIIKKYKL